MSSVEEAKVKARISTWIKIPLLVALVGALVVPATAGAGTTRAARVGSAGSAMSAQASDGNDSIATAVPLPASPVTNTLSYYSDFDDVFSVDLVAGETFSARLVGPSGTDFDLYLFPPGSTNIETDEPVAAAEANNYYPDMLFDQYGAQFVAPTTGTYYLDVFALSAPTNDAAQTYTVTWAKGTHTPEVGISQSATTVNYNGSATFTGVVTDDSDAGLGGQTVELWAQSYPYTSQWTRKAVSTTASVGTTGTYSLTATGITKRTAYQVVVVTQGVSDHAFGLSEGKVVKARASLGAPRVLSGTKYHLKPFTVYGYITPKHTTGQKHVRITAYRADDGVWKTATNYYYSSSTTKYKTTIILPYKGKWKLVASTADDGYHAPTTSSAYYVTVR